MRWRSVRLPTSATTMSPFSSSSGFAGQTLTRSKLRIGGDIYEPSARKLTLLPCFELADQPPSHGGRLDGLDDRVCGRAHQTDRPPAVMSSQPHRGRGAGGTRQDPARLHRSPSRSGIAAGAAPSNGMPSASPTSVPSSPLGSVEIRMDRRIASMRQPSASQAAGRRRRGPANWRTFVDLKR